MLLLLILFQVQPAAPCGQATILAAAKLQEEAYVHPEPANWALLTSSTETHPECAEDFNRGFFPPSLAMSRRVVGTNGLSASGATTLEGLRSAAPNRPTLMFQLLDRSEADLWAWAMESLMPASDPRAWDVDDVATLVLKIRQLDQRAKKELDDNLVSPPAGGMFEPQTLFLFEVLGRLGYRNATGLVQGKYWRFAGIDAPSVLKRPNGSGGFVADPLPRHFPLEWVLCRSEWEQTHGPVDAAGPRKRLAGFEEAQYCEERWMKVDDAAPHPDLDAVRRAMKTLQSEVPQ